jgi:dephospho-CoA kinase
MWKADRMLRVALTGGIGSGKSTVSAMLAERGAVVIDSDVLARQVVALGTPGLAAVVAEFGPDIVTTGGELDRPALGRLVFEDAAARSRLEAIIHPLVRERAEQIEADATGDVVVQDIPLLVETGQQGRFDAVVVVDVPPEVQVERLIRQRGMSAPEAQGRIAAQASREQRLAVADHVVGNDGTLDELRVAVGELWQKLVARAGTA